MTETLPEETALPAAALAPRGDPLLRIRGLRKSFGSTFAVRDLDVDIWPGEIVTLLGPSGCGKTTTLRMVMGLERADSGTIRYQDRLVEGPKEWVPSHRREMGMVFQSYAIWPHMTVEQNIAFPLELRKWRRAKIRSAVDDILDLVGLGGFQKRPATQLSGGQQQRVALARALVYQPALLLLDEPFSNLDAKLREQMRGEVRAIQRELNVSVLFVTHDQDEALGLSDRIILMKAGGVMQADSAEGLYLRPNSPEVRDFIGKTIILHGTIGEIDGSSVECVMPGGNVIWGTLAATDRTATRGEPCEISIRPEHTTVTGLEGADGENQNQRANYMRVRIRAALFHGDRREFQIETRRGQRARVFAPVEFNFSEGDLVGLELPRRHVQVWPGTGTSDQ